MFDLDDYARTGWAMELIAALVIGFGAGCATAGIFILWSQQRRRGPFESRPR
jgi:hypothetical protein